MSNFKDKLSALLNENTEHMIFMDEPVYADIDDEAIAAEISAAAPLYGLKYLGYSEGIVSVSTYQKSAVEKFALFLDDNQYVDNYAISVIESNPLTHSAEVIDEIDFDSTRESEFLEFFIDIAICWNYVQYNDIYIDPQDPHASEESVDLNIPFYTGTGDYPAEYDAGSSFYADSVDKQDLSLKLDKSPGFDVVNSNEVPLLVKLSTIKSNNIDGSILVTVHPKNDDEVLVQAVYKSLPAVDEVMLDLELINSLEDEYGDKLELKTPAQYKLGDLTTTAAVYESINKANVLNIVETFVNSESDVQCDINLLNEIHRKIKVNFRGQKRIKMSCQPGFKYDPSRMACVKISGAEMSLSRIAHRQMARTKKALGAGYRTRILRKVRRAKRFRKMMGIKND